MLIEKEGDFNYAVEVLSKGLKSGSKMVIMSSFDNIAFIHTEIIKEMLKQKENEDFEDEHDINYYLNNKIYDVNQITKSLSPEIIIILINGSANIICNQLITNFIEVKSNSKYYIDCDQEKDLRENESIGFSSRLKYEKLSYIQIKCIKWNIENSNLNSKELSKN